MFCDLGPQIIYQINYAVMRLSAGAFHNFSPLGERHLSLRRLDDHSRPSVGGLTGARPKDSAFRVAHANGILVPSGEDPFPVWDHYAFLSLSSTLAATSAFRPLEPVSLGRVPRGDGIPKHAASEPPVELKPAK